MREGTALPRVFITADPNAFLFAFPIPSFPHTADPRIHTHTTSSIRTSATLRSRESALRALPFPSHLSAAARHVSIISAIAQRRISFFIILICKSSLSVAALAEAERERERDRQRDIESGER